MSSRRERFIAHMRGRERPSSWTQRHIALVLRMSEEEFAAYEAELAVALVSERPGPDYTGRMTRALRSVLERAEKGRGT